MASPQDAAIATTAELEALTKQFGVYLIAENAGYSDWIAEKRQGVLTQIAKTRKELQRLESSLQRLEQMAHSMGRDHSAQPIEREYTPLEGWALTLVGNYAGLLANLGTYQRNELCDRLGQFTRGVIVQAKGGDASQTLGRVREFLSDASLMYR